MPAGKSSTADFSRFLFELEAGTLGVGLDSFIFIDPPVAIGYDYEVVNGPLFSSMILPSIGDEIFELFLFDDTLNDFVFEDFINSDELYSFTPGGVDRFRILGIEMSAALDPNDPTAFVTGLTFTGPGAVSMSQTPITVELLSVPEPATLALLGLGLAGLGFARRKCSA